jgi:hypothetical protein
MVPVAPPVISSCRGVARAIALALHMDPGEMCSLSKFSGLAESHAAADGALVPREIGRMKRLWT